MHWLNGPELSETSEKMKTPSVDDEQEQLELMINELFSDSETDEQTDLPSLYQHTWQAPMLPKDAAGKTFGMAACKVQQPSPEQLVRLAYENQTLVYANQILRENLFLASQNAADLSESDNVKAAMNEVQEPSMEVFSHLAYENQSLACANQVLRDNLFLVSQNIAKQHHHSQRPFTRPRVPVQCTDMQWPQASYAMSADMVYPQSAQQQHRFGAPSRRAMLPFNHQFHLEKEDAVWMPEENAVWMSDKYEIGPNRGPRKTIYRPQAVSFMEDTSAFPPTVDGCSVEHLTTVMLRNLPNSYARKNLLDMLDNEGFAGLYDFVYLPIDFRKQGCYGYAFINLVDPQDACRFWEKFNGYSDWILPSKKVCGVTWSGPSQGLVEHVERYRNSPIMHSSVPDEWKPTIFSHGVRIEFPLPTKKIRAPRMRYMNEVNHVGAYWNHNAN